VLIGGADAADAKKEEPAYEYGPPPSWEEFRQLSETTIRAMLIDPESAQFTWTRGYYKAYWKPLFSRKVYGYLTCGYVNSKNRMGGYVGATPFVVVIDRGQVLHAELGSSTGSGYVNWGCTEGMKRGLLPPLDRMPQTNHAPEGGPYGFTMSVVADGAYVASVATGSSAESAGLKPGMVISHLNGVALKGLSEAVIRQILDNAGATATLTIVGGQTFRVGRAPPISKVPAKFTLAPVPNGNAFSPTRHGLFA
jgi:hypothetical protein